MCVKPLALGNGTSRVELTATAEMVVDERGLVHGGIVFSLADYAAMIAVNHPNVVLGAAAVKFLKPVCQGEQLIAEAKVTHTSGKKRIVAVNAQSGGRPVFEGEFTCFVLEKHVLAD